MEEKMGATIASALRMQKLSIRKPYLFDFYFYLPDENKAQGLANELRVLGYRTDVRSAATEDKILCLATKLFVPEEKAMDELGATFNSLATRYGGEFDGWEAGID